MKQLNPERVELVFRIKKKKNEKIKLSLVFFPGLSPISRSGLVPVPLGRYRHVFSISGLSPPLALLLCLSVWEWGDSKVPGR